MEGEGSPNTVGRPARACAGDQPQDVPQAAQRAVGGAGGRGAHGADRDGEGLRPGVHPRR